MVVISYVLGRTVCLCVILVSERMPFLLLWLNLLYYGFRARKERYIAMNVNMIKRIGRIYAYGNSFDALQVAYCLCWKAIPNIDRDNIRGKYDQIGEHTKWDELISEVRRGDHLVVASIFALELAGENNAMIHRLHKLRDKGVEVHVILEPNISIEDYDAMLKTWHLSQKQKQEFLSCCGLPYEPEV